MISRNQKQFGKYIVKKPSSILDNSGSVYYTLQAEFSVFGIAYLLFNDRPPS